YVAAQLLLDSFERLCAAGELPTDRQAVRDAVLATTDFSSVIGKFSIDKNGDTTLTTMSGSQVKNGKFEFVTLLGGG
ncbi:MAG: branched-chain amino acid ABC transporter substrate-binding protein, partial [Chloroflexota bacterium]